MTRTRAVAYLRVSTAKQADLGLSLDAQAEKVRLYAQLHDLDIVESIVDAGESAKSLHRPGLQRALAMLGAGQADALLVVKLDRLTRSVRDLGELVSTHFAPGRHALLSVSEQVDTRTAAGRLVLNVLGSVSQWEREATAERTSQVMQHMSQSGLFVGGTPPYGYSVGAGKLEPVASEQSVIALAREAHTTGGLTYRAIARELRARGIVSRTGRAFDSTQVRRFLQRPSAAPSEPLPATSATFRSADPA